MGNMFSDDDVNDPPSRSSIRNDDDEIMFSMQKLFSLFIL